jgi:hypothetical protein
MGYSPPETGGLQVFPSAVDISSSMGARPDLADQTGGQRYFRYKSRHKKGLYRAFHAMADTIISNVRANR